MKIILLMIGMVAMFVTGCQTMNPNNKPDAFQHSSGSDWTYGGGAVGLP